MKVNAISDTHGLEFDTEPCDLLLFAGDFNHLPYATKNHPEILLAHAEMFLEWLSNQPAKKIMMIAGNHDFACALPEFRKLAEEYGVTYLEDESETFEGVTVHGYPWTPWFHDWAYNLPKYDFGVVAKEKLAKVQEGTDILLSHGPPLHACDSAYGKSLGCPYLKDTIHRVQPKYVVCGHIHESAGEVSQIWDTTIMNVSARTHGMFPRSPRYTTFEV